MLWEPNLSTQKIAFCPKVLKPKTSAKLSNRKQAEQKNDGQNYNRQLLRRPRPKAENGPAVLKTACPRTNILVEIMCHFLVTPKIKPVETIVQPALAGRPNKVAANVEGFVQAGDLENVQPGQKPNKNTDVH